MEKKRIMQFTEDDDWEEYFEGYVRAHNEMPFTEVVEHIGEKLDISLDDVISDENGRTIIDNIWDTGNNDSTSTELIDTLAEEFGISTKDFWLDSRNRKTINALYKTRVLNNPYSEEFLPDTTLPYGRPQIERFQTDMSRQTLIASESNSSASELPPSGPSRDQPDKQSVLRSKGRSQTDAKRIAAFVEMPALIASTMPVMIPYRKISDGINAIVRQVAGRLGQTKFRQDLFKNYGCRCLITGCTVPHVVEAAHIRPYKSKGDFIVDNGLPLRSDLHMLFDQNLLAFHPDTLKVELHPKLIGTEYGCFLGQPLKLDNAQISPNKAALKERHEAFLEAQNNVDYSYADVEK